MGRKLLIYVFLIVITDPYKGLKYQQINAYHYEQTYQVDVIHVHYPENSPDEFIDDIEEEEEDEEEDEEEEDFIPWRPPWQK